MKTVIKRLVFYIQIQLESPLNVASGEDEWTDADILLDFDGNPFVPGNSLAGAMRSYIGEKDNEWELFGFSKDDIEGKMSPLLISDLVFDQEPVIGVRDGVGLNEKKVVKDGCKFDMEILETGLKGHFYLELVVREGDLEEEMKKQLAIVFQGIQQGEIRLGRKKTRGFGAFKITRLSVRSYGKDNYLKYADAYKASTWEKASNELENWLHTDSDSRRMIHIEVPLVMKGGISIRQYAAKKNEPDFVHITSNGVPVISGSSFAGAIRHRVEQILGELEAGGTKLPVKKKEILQIMFGYVEETAGNQATDAGDGARQSVNAGSGHASNVVISEARILDARPLTMVRTGISRFESAVHDGALYKEKTYVDGHFTLKIAVQKGKQPVDAKWMTGILLLAENDLRNGYLAVGGQTAVGRGVFAPDTSEEYPKGVIFIDGKPRLENQFIAEAFNCLCAHKR